jgi:hypothetical protein
MQKFFRGIDCEKNKGKVLTKWWGRGIMGEKWGKGRKING